MILTAPGSPTPPNDRTVVPHIAEIERLCTADPLRRSKDQIFKDAGLSGSRLLRNWTKGQKPYRSTLERLVAELPDCEDVEQLILHSPRSGGLLDTPSVEAAFRDLALDALHSDEFTVAATRASGCNIENGVDQVEVLSFLMTHYRSDLAGLPIDLPTMIECLRELCRGGWLWETPGRHDSRFYARAFNRLQCDVAHKLRDFIEIEAMRYVYDLAANPSDESAMQEHRAILDAQSKHVEKLKEDARALAENPVLENVGPVINSDSRFHAGWAGQDPLYSVLLPIVVGGHLQPILRLSVAERQLVRRKGSLPDGVPSVVKLVEPWAAEVESIYCQFCVACAKRSGLEPVLDDVRKHSKNGYDFILQAEALKKIG